MKISKKKIFKLVLFIILCSVGCTTSMNETAPQDSKSLTPVSDTSTISESTLPEYLGYVFPKQSTTFNLESEEYKQELNIYNYGQTDPSICVGVDSFPLMEIGDRPSTDEFVEQISLSIDNQQVKDKNFIEGYDSLGEEWYTEDGEFLFRTPDGLAFNICWPAELSVGNHTATFTFTRTSGVEEKYTWSFTVVD